RNARRHPDQIGMAYGERRWTWKQVDDRSNQLANMFLASGLKKGDRVAILDQNSDTYMEIYFGLAKAGIIAVPINYRLSPEEMINLMSNAEPEALILGRDYFKLAESLGKQLPSVKRLIGIGSPLEGMEDYESLLSGQPVEEPRVDLSEDDVFSIMYTSGTTGLPKGAVSTHRNYIMNALVVIIADHSSREDKNLIVSPLYHAGALFYSTAYMYLGCPQVILKQFDPKAVLEGIEKEKISVCLLIPTMLNFVLNHPDFGKHDMSSLRRIFYGGGPMPLPILEKAIHSLRNCGFTQGYGLTETLETNLLLAEDHVLGGTPKQQDRLKSAGRESATYEVKVVDDWGKEVPQGEIGEVWVKGPAVIKGFWRNPEETAKTIEDGWFKTGDLGRMDEDRYLYIVDRKKDMIISGGENIYAKEIDDVLHRHPAVLEAAAIGVPDKDWGEAVKAVIVPRTGMTATEEEIIQFCKERLASYKKPKSVEFVEELPKTASGKILKRDLREKYWKGYERRVH
ncbi:MAG: long-chain-fatty-acid--CoA ligase, partial [Deltaproteobacteria bacterium]